MPETIVEGGDQVQFEAVAQETITPGELVRYDTNGDLVLEDSDGAAIHGYVAMEQAELGKGIDYDYSSGEQAKVTVPGAGDRVFVYLAGGETVDPTTPLYVGTSGVLRTSANVASASDGGIFGYPTASHSPSSDTRIEVRVSK